jgi:pyrroline-5-carboxylate reductase
MIAQQPIGFLGAGQMATALAKSWLAAGLVQPEAVLASDPYPTARVQFAQAVGVPVSPVNRPVAERARLLVVAVKPGEVPVVLDEIAPVVTPQKLVVSIAAGVTIAQLEERLPPGARVVRVMPNTPCLVGASATGYAAGSHASPEDLATVERLFTAVGRAVMVRESMLDAVTGLSGSGPAYVYLMIEALADGGVRAGLPRAVAQLLAAQTVLGAAQMVLQTQKHPGELKDMVASPGGTTIAGLHALERGGVRAALMDAVLAATTRAQELGRAANAAANAAAANAAAVPASAAGPAAPAATAAVAASVNPPTDRSVPSPATPSTQAPSDDA